MIHYNALVVEAADRYVFEGHADKAIEIYRLVAHFYCCDGLADDVRPRLRIAERIAEGFDVEGNKRELVQLKGGTPLMSSLSQIHPKTTVPRDNLLDLRVLRFPLPSP